MTEYTPRPSLEEFIAQRFRNLEARMSTEFSQLGTDVSNLTAAFTTLQAAVNTALANIAAEIAALKAATPSIAPQLAALEAAVAEAGTITGQIQAADPGSQPAPAAPTP